MRNQDMMCFFSACIAWGASVAMWSGDAVVGGGVAGRVVLPRMAEVEFPSSLNNPNKHCGGVKSTSAAGSPVDSGAGEAERCPRQHGTRHFQHLAEFIAATKRRAATVSAPFLETPCRSKALSSLFYFGKKGRKKLQLFFLCSPMKVCGVQRGILELELGSSR